MSDGTFVSWLALDDEKKLLSGMFTDPDYRRKGISTELLNRVVNEAREYGCSTIQITASDMGVLLYTNYGFKKNNNFMYYNL